MRASSSFGQILTAAVALSGTVAAWPQWLPDVDALVVRQDTTPPPSATQTADPTTQDKASPTDDKATPTDDGNKSDAPKKTDDPNTANLNTGGMTITGSGKDSKPTGKGGNSTHSMFDPRDPVGGISMITPAPTDGTQLYRIGDTVTWKWNYTSLQGTPTAIDVLVSCSVATETWTLTQNMTYEQTGSFTWDTNAYKETAVDKQLLTEEYTLIIYDADSSIKATVDPGYLGVFNQFKFGMYTPKPYQNLGEWKCATCSAGNSDLDRKALGFALSMSVITVLSFTWFVAGFGALA